MAGRSAAARGAVGQAMNVALAATEHESRDGATVALAVRLAAAVDTAPVDRLGELSGRLLTVLAALGMTPAARSAVAKGVPADDSDREPAGVAGSSIGDLRARARSRRAAVVDPSAS